MQVNVSYTAPTGETTESSGWAPEVSTWHRWTQTLAGGSFIGRYVTEQDPGGGGPDYCHFVGSIYDPFVAVTTPGYLWTVDTGNKWQYDYVGWNTGAVEYYRNRTAPCDTQFPQRMEITITRPGNSNAAYVTNTLRAGITNTTVWSERAGQYAERIWP